MTDRTEKQNPKSPLARERFAEAAHSQMMEGNPLDAADKALFEMFDREGWSYDEREAYIIDLVSRESSPSAAE
ncbi:hypothetical protein [Shimia sediminis]|uniref:hypothetical protein n=1 Tax=Shimia sediminis TaxID=2497945 RepID=UPI000F8C799D|nr:hypothetical protein [Shimia sediminis]